MNASTLKQLSKQLIHEGQRLVEEECFTEAKSKFEESVALYPTAEGLTFWAWMESYLGHLTLAINLCKKAICLNPNFGNAYNDIGCYLIIEEKYTEAIEWLEKAKGSSYYDYPQYPYLNLGRLYLKLGLVEKARQEFLGALTYDPHNLEARYMIHHFNTDDQFEEGLVTSHFDAKQTTNKQYISVFSVN